jgi:hypothetical protein
MSTIEAILSNEALYGNGPPRWKQKGKTGEAETAQTAEQRAQQLTKWLRKADPTLFPKARALSKKLDDCRPKHRCQSAACPMCARAYQRWMVHEAHALLGKPTTHTKKETGDA